MRLFWVTRDSGVYEEFHIHEVNPKYYTGIDINQVWELNNSDMEAEVYVEEETLKEAAIKALCLFNGEY